MSNVEKAKQYLLGMNELDVDLALSGFSETASYMGLSKQDDGKLVRHTYEPKSAIHEYISNWVGGASDKLHYEFRAVMEDGDTVMIEWEDVAQGKGNEYTNQGVLVYEFEDGQIERVRMYCDWGPLMDWHFLEG